MFVIIKVLCERPMEHKSEKQKSTINNLKIFKKVMEKVIKLLDDYATVLSKDEYESKHRKRLS